MVVVVINITCEKFGVSKTTFYIIRMELQEFTIEECERNMKVA